MAVMDSLEKITQEVISCKECGLYKGRLNPVVGAGNLEARIMFVGEAPGANEDRTGVPFCGAAGGILDELLEKIRIKRRDIYITNILKCRPPGNRNPAKEEIKMCTPYLDRQIEIIKPEVICCLGNFATSYTMEKFGLKGKIQGISRIHGSIFDYQSLFASIKIMPLYHPAVVTYNINMKSVLERDFMKLRTFL